MYFVLLLIFTNVVFQSKAQLSSAESGEDDKKCKEPKCKVVCPYGYELDKKGCKTCDCVDPCTNNDCPKGEVCQVEPIVCQKGDCGYTTICVSECPDINCAIHCPYGYEVDKNGCDTCTCIDYCKCHKCPRGKDCVAEEICPGDQCGIDIKCIRKCPTLLCHKNARCKYGWELDCDNCPTCRCLDPCKTVICPQYSYCAVNCLELPCPRPRAECKPYCPTGSPLIGSEGPVQCSQDEGRCPNGYVCNSIAELDLSYCCTAREATNFAQS